MKCKKKKAIKKNLEAFSFQKNHYLRKIKECYIIWLRELVI